jgi:hypothetical protein
MKNNPGKFLLLLFLLIPFMQKAQSFADGTNLVYLGFGLPAGQGIQEQFSDYRNYTDYKFNNYGTAVLKFEHGLHKYFGLGLNAEYSAASVTYKYDDSNSLRYQVNINSNVFGIYARMNGHYPVSEKFDLYAGAGLGYLYTVNNYKDNNPANSNEQHNSRVLNFDYQLSLGARFMVKQGFGLFAEIGRATTTCQLGIVMKF